MNWIFGALNSDKIEIKYYGPFPTTIENVTAFLGLNLKFLREPTIFANGIIVNLDYSLNGPTYLEIFYGEATSIVEKPVIIWEDEDLGVVFKPAGLATQPQRFRAEANLASDLKTILNCDIHIPSRLDFGVAGLLVFSKTKKACKFVHKLYSNKLIGKHYVLVSSEKSSWYYKYIKTGIEKDSFHPALRRVVEGESAESLFYNPNIKVDEGWVYFVKIFTGKTHQIRLHSKNLGIPVLGDFFYNREHPNGLHLLCYCLRFNYKNSLLEFYVPPQFLPKWFAENERISKSFQHFLRNVF
ncbi:MAG: pseudouridine synthase [Deltaproteobacteria bacterium]|nr:pseudouridine synthase [Deltaproteobacteria bacterium]